MDIQKEERNQQSAKPKRKPNNSILGNAYGVTLRQNTNRTGTKSLYLDIHRNGARYKEYLGASYLLIGNSLLDKETIRLAKEIMFERASEIREQGVSVLSSKSRADFFTWLASDADKSKVQMLRTVANLLKDFLPSLQTIPFRAIDRELLQKFQEYLLTRVSANSALAYLSCLKASIRRAIKKGYLNTDPFVKIDKVKGTEVEKEFLTIDELKTLQSTYEQERLKITNSPLSLGTAKEQLTTNLNYIEALRAFLFACFTGLRLSDVKRLTWEQVREKEIIIRQTKTKGLVTVPIYKQVYMYLGNRNGVKDSDLVFNLKDDVTTNKGVKRYTEQFNRHMTFHSARHTYATILLTKGVRIEVISKLLGHQNLTTSLVYAKIIDTVRTEAVLLLEEL
jgi:integrase